MNFVPGLYVTYTKTLYISLTHDLYSGPVRG